MDNISYSDFEKELVNNYDKYKFDASQFKEGFSNFETFAPFGNYEHMDSEPQQVGSNTLLLGDNETDNTQTIDEVEGDNSGTVLASANVSSDNNETEQDDNVSDSESETPQTPDSPQPLPQDSTSSLSQGVVEDSNNGEDDETQEDNELSAPELVQEILEEETEESNEENLFSKYKFFIIIILVALVVALSSAN